MKRYVFDGFGLDRIRLETAAEPQPGPGEIVVDVKAISLNFRDLLVLTGRYNPKLRLPAVPISDGAGVVVKVGPDVGDLRVSDRVMTQYVPDWRDGRYRFEYLRSTLGTPGPGMAAERVALPRAAVLPMPNGYDFGQAATLPIAGLTAWSALHAGGPPPAGATVLTLGTGGVSIFALQIAKALGLRFLITSSSDEKLRRAAALGADHGINYRTQPEWPKVVMELTGGAGADITIETGGIQTLDASMSATRSDGAIAMLGALTGLQGPINAAPILMKQLHIHGILVGSRAAFAEFTRFLEAHAMRPVIDRVFPFEELPAALRFLQDGAHFGKIVLTRD